MGVDRLPRKHDTVVAAVDGVAGGVSVPIPRLGSAMVAVGRLIPDVGRFGVELDGKVVVLVVDLLEVFFSGARDDRVAGGVVPCVVVLLVGEVLLVETDLLDAISVEDAVAVGPTAIGNVRDGLFLPTTNLAAEELAETTNTESEGDLHPPINRQGKQSLLFNCTGHVNLSIRCFNDQNAIVWWSRRPITIKFADGTGCYHRCEGTLNCGSVEKELDELGMIVYDCPVEYKIPV